MAQRTMGSPMIAIVLPSRQRGPGVIQRCEPGDVQTLVPQASGKRLAQPVFHGRPGADEIELDTPLACPSFERLGREFVAMIDGNRNGYA